MINWFEIPSVDFERAVNFYSTVLGISIKKELFNGVPNGIFVAEGKSFGAVIYDEQVRPSQDGAVLYLDGGSNLEAAVNRVEPAGGKVLMPVTPIGDPGFIALILDTEGNRIALHTSPK